VTRAALLLLLVYLGAPAARAAEEPVVLLHGLGRSAASMRPMAEALEAAAFRVCNVGYPSREHSVEVLTVEFVAPQVLECLSGDTGRTNFVTHSLGGIVVRQLSASGAFAGEFGRVVMLSPPNQGSEVVDRLGGLWLFRTMNGPAGGQLGTGTDSLPRSLGPAPFEVGIITGTRSINPLLSLLIPGADDGKVAVDNARLEGMTDFLAVPVSHPFIMRSAEVIDQTLHFLRYGSFAHEPIR
jgi:pimeloyl-ACP methyl ester carboxylesterase